MCTKPFLRTVFVLSCLLPAAARAGAIFLPGELAEGKFVANQEAKGPVYSIRYSTVTAAVADGVARVKIEEAMVGPEKAVDTVCLIPLPEGANGRNATCPGGHPLPRQKPLPAARFLEAADQRFYEAAARGLDNVKILALSGRPALIVPRFHLQGKVEITVEFQQKFRQQGGVCRLECPMPLAGFARPRGPALRQRDPCQPGAAAHDLCPTHTTTVDRNGLHKAVARVKANNYSGTDDLCLFWVADQDDLGLRVLACKPDVEEDGYFLLVGNPTGSPWRRRPRKRRDLRARHERLHAGREDRQARRPSSTPGTDQRGRPIQHRHFRHRVTGFCEARSPVRKPTLRRRGNSSTTWWPGRNEHRRRLTRALGGEKTNRRPIVIFLTDGTPTVGELIPENIIPLPSRRTRPGRESSSWGWATTSTPICSTSWPKRPAGAANISCRAKKSSQGG